MIYKCEMICDLVAMVIWLPLWCEYYMVCGWYVSDNVIAMRRVVNIVI